MNIALHVLRDWRTAIALVMQGAILGYYTLVNPDVPGGQFVAGFALGLMLMVVILGIHRARREEHERAMDDRISDFTRQ